MTPELTLSGRTATIRLDAPERRNALGPDDLQALAAALARIETSADAEVAILTASGDTFCAGYDLGAMRRELRASQASAAQSAFADVVDTLENLRVPTICAIGGGIYGGGGDLALACDFRVGTPRASLKVPAARLGLQFYYGGLRRYVERLGADNAKRIFLTAGSFGSEELLRIGFLHEIVPEAELAGRVDELAATLLANAQTAVRGLKRSLNAIARGTARSETIDDAFFASFREPETVERLTGSPPRDD
jgi:enoyl-CoA hydratase/carnithine racemase